jgi:hypothetical protein
MTAYLEAVKEHGSAGFWTWCPAELLVAQKEVAAATSYVRKFLALGPEDDGADTGYGELVYTVRDDATCTSIKAIKDAFKAFMRQHHRGAKTTEVIDRASMELAGFIVEEGKNTCKACKRFTTGRRCCDYYDSSQRSRGIVVHGISLIREVHDTSSPMELRFKAAVERVTGMEWCKQRPEWLVNSMTGRLMELDMVNVALSAAVEYNGAQHYEYPNAFHATRQSFDEQRERDVLKHALCVANGVRLIAIRARENLEDELGDFRAQCATLGVSW